MKKSTQTSANDLSARLISYGVTAGALMLTGNSMDGQIAYSGIQNLVFDTPGILNPIDLNDDGTTDFEVGLAWDSYILNGFTTYSAFIRNPGTINGWIGNGMAYLLSYSYLISYSRTWTDSVFSYYNLGIASSSWFLGAGNALLGIRFINYIPVPSGHYGWMRINIDARAEEFVVVDWAYEETPNAPIPAGVLTENLIPPEPQLFADVMQPVKNNFTIGINFSEPVTGFEPRDIEVDGGSVVLGSLHSDDQQHFTAVIRPEVEGEIIIKLPGSVASDADGNLNMPAANKLYIDYLAVPIPEFNTNVEEPVSGPFEVELSFSEAVNGMAKEHIFLSNGIIEPGTFVELSPDLYRFKVIPAGTGFIVVELPAGAVTDIDANDNIAATPLILEADLDAPRVDISSSETQPVNGPFEIELRFNEEVEGLHEADLRISNGFVSAGSLATDDQMVYSAGILPDQSGTVEIQLPANAAFDNDGFGNLASDTLRVSAEIIPGTLSDNPKAECSIFPNPSSGTFILETQKHHLGWIASIYSASGQVIFQTTIESGTTELDLSGYPAGIYHLHLASGKEEINERLIIE